MTSSIVESPTKIGGAIRPVAADQVKVCDFRAAGALDTSRLAPLAAANEAFAKNLAATFSTRFETPCEISVSSVDMAVCEAFVEGAAEKSAYFHSLILGTHAEAGVLQVDSSVLFTLLDCLMGGSGGSTQAAREITEIEGQMARELVKVIAQELQNAWRAYKIEVKVGSQQSPEQLLQTLPEAATALVPSFSINIAQASGTFQLMLPIPSIAPFLKVGQAKSSLQLSKPASTMSPRLANELSQATFAVDLVLSEGKLQAQQMLELAAGQVLSLGVPSGTPVALHVGGRAAFSALPIRSGDHRAAQLLERLGTGKLEESGRTKSQRL
jgi:flagellar motor switch protein FliM